MSASGISLSKEQEKRLHIIHPRLPNLGDPKRETTPKEVVLVHNPKEQLSRFTNLLREGKISTDALESLLEKIDLRRGINKRKDATVTSEYSRHHKTKSLNPIILSLLTHVRTEMKKPQEHQIPPTTISKVEARALRVISLYNSGAPIFAISEELDIHYKSVHRILRRNKVETTRHAKGWHHTPETIAQIKLSHWTKNPAIEQDTRKKLKDAKIGHQGYWLNRKFSDAHKLNISRAQKQKILDRILQGDVKHKTAHA
jgi:hypothetical protein